jgi:hypothetical protein
MVEKYIKEFSFHIKMKVLFEKSDFFLFEIFLICKFFFFGFSFHFSF